MSRFLIREDVKCTILTTDLGLTSECLRALNGVNVIALPCINKRYYLPKCSYGMIKDVVEDADIIHIMNHWTVLNALVYFSCRSLKKPYVICAAGALPIYGRSKGYKRIYNWIVGKKIINNAQACIAITPDEISHFRSYGVDAARIITIPNGISREGLLIKDDEGFRKKYGLGDGPFILFVGRLNRIKGPDLLLEAFCNTDKRLQNYQLVFAGADEGMLNDLKETVAANKMEKRVKFVGFLQGEDKSRAYQAAELLVIPSRQEAMSIVVLEAGIVGTPVLLTDQCGFNEIEQINGGMVVPATAEGLRKGLVELCANPGELKARGEKLQENVMKRFLWDALIKDYLNLYDGILGNSRTLE